MKLTQIRSGVADSILKQRSTSYLVRPSAKAAVALILSAALIPQAQACRMAQITDEQRMQFAEAVFHGVVTGIRIPAWESAQPVGAAGDNRKAYRNNRTDFEYRVVADETLKGKAAELLIFNVSWCDGGRADLMDEVTVYRSADTRWYIKSRVPDRK